MKTLLLALAVSFSLSHNAQAKIACEVLHPNLQEKNIVVDGKAKLEAEGILSKYIGGSGSLEGLFANRDSLNDYNNPDELAKWYSRIYLACSIIADDKSLSIDDKLRVYKELLNEYSNAVRVEEEVSNPAYDTSYKPESIDLSTLEVGRPLKQFGENLILKKSRSNEKYISSRNKNGFFIRDNLSLKKDWKVEAVLQFTSSRSQPKEIILKGKKSWSVTVKFDDNKVFFGGDEKALYNIGWVYPHQNGYNRVTLKIYDDVVSLLINGNHVGSVDITPDLEVKSFMLRGLEKGDRLIGFSTSKGL